MGAALFTYTDPGELTLKEAGALLALILPMFMVYLGSMFKELVGGQYQALPPQEGGEAASAPKEPMVKKFNAMLYQGISIVYPILIFLIIRYKVIEADDMPIEDAQIWLGAVESAFSIWLGTVINSLFKQGEKGA